MRLRHTLVAALLVTSGTAWSPSSPAQAVGETLVGTITDPLGVPVAGATVLRVWCLSPACVQSTTTSAGGAYAFADAPQSAYTLAVTPPNSRPDLVEYWTGGVLGQFRNGAPYASFGINAGIENVQDVQLPYGGTISGTITKAGGVPVSGASVRAILTTAQGAVNVKSTLTDGSGHYVLVGLPGNAGLVGPGPSLYRVTVSPPFGNTSLLVGTIPGSGQYTINAGGASVGTAITNADLQLANAITGTANIYQNNIRLTTLPQFSGAGLCVYPDLFLAFSPFCTSVPLSAPVVDPDGTQRIGPLQPGTYTVRGVQVFVAASSVHTTMTLIAGDTFACNIPLDASIVPVCVVTHAAVDDGDGASTADEAGAPNGGDGNLDGLQDSSQPDVASKPDPTGGYFTVDSTDGYPISGLTVVAPSALSGTLPNGLDAATGIASYKITVPTPGDSAHIDLYVDDPGPTITAVWKYQGGIWVDATSLVTSFTPLGDGRTRVSLLLTDNGGGDGDHLLNGVIDDPIGFGAVPFAFSGFKAPVSNPPAVNSVNAGLNVPLKWQLSTSSGQPIADPASIYSLRLVPGGCPTIPNFAQTDILATGSLLNQGGGQWHLNWNTPKTLRGCGTVELTLADSTVHTAVFNFR